MHLRGAGCFGRAAVTPGGFCAILKISYEVSDKMNKETSRKLLGRKNRIVLLMFVAVLCLSGFFALRKRAKEPDVIYSQDGRSIAGYMIRKQELQDTLHILMDRKSARFSIQAVAQTDKPADAVVLSSAKHVWLCAESGSFGTCRILIGTDDGRKIYLPPDCSYLFDIASKEQIVTVDFGQNIDTSRVQSMDYMFWDMTSLESLDICGFDTSGVTGMVQMFGGCRNLEVIYAGNGWTTQQAMFSDDMFKDCISLAGSETTGYMPEHEDREYACIDQGQERPGYLTPERYLLKQVDITGIEPPTGGRKLDTGAVCRQQGIQTPMPGISYTVSSGGREQTASGVAAYHTAYTMRLSITPKEGYCFAETTKATVNGDGQTVTGIDAGGRLLVTYTFEETAKARLLDVQKPEEITDLKNGTKREDILSRLPQTVGIRTEDELVTTAPVTWNVEQMDTDTYDPSELTGQAFELDGTLRLPDSIWAASEELLHVAVRITVDEAQQAVAPTVWPVAERGHSYQTDQTVTLQSRTEGAAIYYTMTLDGSKPPMPQKGGAGSIRYTSPFSVRGEAGRRVRIRIKAIAVKEQMRDSEAAEFVFDIELPKRNYSSVTAKDAVYTYTGSAMDVSLLFGGIPADAGERTYELLTDGEKSGMSKSMRGSMLTVHRAGEYHIRMHIAETQTYHGMSADAVLTVQKGEGRAVLYQEDVVYGADYTPQVLSADYDVKKVLLRYRRQETDTWLSDKPKEAGKYVVEAQFQETELYEAKIISKSYQIMKKELLIKAQDQTITEQETPDAYAYVIEGFAGKDTMEKVIASLAKVAVACDMQTGSNAQGRYEGVLRMVGVTDRILTPYGRQNYRLNTQSGVLRMTAFEKADETEAVSRAEDGTDEEEAVKALGSISEPEAVMIYFDANGGDGSMDAMAVVKNSRASLPSSTFSAPEGKVFKGWAVDPAGGIQVIEGENDTFEQDTTVYALWEDIDDASSVQTDRTGSEKTSKEQEEISKEQETSKEQEKTSKEQEETSKEQEEASKEREAAAAKEQQLTGRRDDRPVQQPNEGQADRASKEAADDGDAAKNDAGSRLTGGTDEKEKDGGETVDAGTKEESNKKARTADLSGSVAGGMTKEERKEVRKQLAANAAVMNAGLKITQRGKKLTVKWGKLMEADGYEIYVSYCDEYYDKEPSRTIPNGSISSAAFKEMGGERLDPARNFKVRVIAYKESEQGREEIGRTLEAHIAGSESEKYTNVKRVIVSKKKLAMNAGEAFQIRAEEVPVDAKKRQLGDAHAPQFRYVSTNPDVAAVSADGLIRAVTAGRCVIYVYARNGRCRKIRVTVR